MAPINGANTMLTARDLARLLHVHINTVRRWSNRGLLKAYRVGPRGDRRFKKEDIALFIAESGVLIQKAVREHSLAR